MIHPTAQVMTEHIGEGTTVWQFAIVLAGARIGANCNINSHTFIENDVVIGDNVTVKCGVYLWDGARIEDNVFLGPNATFTNDNTPRSRQARTFPTFRVKRGASVGANATVLPGVTIGEYALIGAGAVVTKDVPAYALMVGNPARRAGWVGPDGDRLQPTADGRWYDRAGRRFVTQPDGTLSPQTLTNP